MQFQSFSSWIDSQKLFELNQNSTVHHRSMKKMKLGGVIKPKTLKTGEYVNSEFFENKEKNPTVVDSIILEFEELFVDPEIKYTRYKSKDGNVLISGILKPGKKFMISLIQTNVGGNLDRGSRYSVLQFFPFVFGKYLWRGQERKFPQITEIGITGFSMKYFKHSNSTLRDASRYMKKISQKNE